MNHYMEYQVITFRYVNIKTPDVNIIFESFQKI